MRGDGKSGGKIIECCFIIDLLGISGRVRLEKRGHKVFVLCEFEGELSTEIKKNAWGAL